MKKIIVISGKQYSGKDTVAKILLGEFPNFKRIGIGDAIKIEYGKQKGLALDEIIENKHLYRSDLIKLGDWGRAQDPDYWLYKLIDMKDDIIVPDIRVSHELETFKAQGAFLLRVEASKEARALRGTITNENDPTETMLDSYKEWNYKLDNSFDYDTLVVSCAPLIQEVKKFFHL